MELFSKRTGVSCFQFTRTVPGHEHLVWLTQPFYIFGLLCGNRLHALFNLTALRCKKLFTPCLRRIESLTGDGFISNTAKGTIAF